MNNAQRFTCIRVLLEDGITEKPTHFTAVSAADFDQALKPKWQHIRTAPAEGHFLVYMPKEMSKVQAARKNRNGVFIIGNNFAFDMSPATHWMPLPELPE
jgi:hypothetical protein